MANSVAAQPPLATSIQPTIYELESHTDFLPRTRRRATAPPVPTRTEHEAAADRTNTRRGHGISNAMDANVNDALRVLCEHTHSNAAAPEGTSTTARPIFALAATATGAPPKPPIQITATYAFGRVAAEAKMIAAAAATRIGTQPYRKYMTT